MLQQETSHFCDVQVLLHKKLNIVSHNPKHCSFPGSYLRGNMIASNMIARYLDPKGSCSRSIETLTTQSLDLRPHHGRICDPPATLRVPSADPIAEPND